MERNRINKSTTLSLTLRVLFAIAMLGLALSFLHNYADILNGLVLAWVIVLVASPLLHRLLDKGIPTWLSFALTLLAILVVPIIFIILMVMAVELLVDALPDYSTQFESLMASVQDSMPVLGIDSFDLEAISRYINPTGVVDFAAEFLAGLIGTVSNMVFVALLVIFMMLDALNVPAKLLKEIQAGNNYLQQFF
jgi:AI-2 transport protein TqsA